MLDPVFGADEDGIAGIELLQFLPGDDLLPHRRFREHDPECITSDLPVDQDAGLLVLQEKDGRQLKGENPFERPLDHARGKIGTVRRSGEELHREAIHHQGQTGNQAGPGGGTAMKLRDLDQAVQKRIVAHIRVIAGIPIILRICRIFLCHRHVFYFNTLFSM